MALKELKKFFMVDEENEEEYEDEIETFSHKDSDVVSAYKNNSVKNSQLVLTEPRAYSESQSIADHIKEKRAVVVNLQRVTPEQAKRIVDFLSGTVYALDGDIQKIGGNIFLCTPNSVSVAGEISEDSNETRKW